MYTHGNIKTGNWGGGPHKTLGDWVHLPSFKKVHTFHTQLGKSYFNQAGPASPCAAHYMPSETFTVSCHLFAQHVPQHWGDRSSKASPVLTGDHSYIQHLTDTLHFFSHVTVWRKPVRHESWRRSGIFLTMQEAPVNTHALVMNRLITHEISRQAGCSEVERQRYGGRG